MTPIIASITAWIQPVRNWLASPFKPLTLGQRGERAAAIYLRRLGYKIVAHGERGKIGELDLVAVDRRTVVFVEVKTRRTGDAGDPAEAARWYRLAADGDDIRAQYELGDLYFKGIGVARDYVSAYVWFSVAAGQAPLEDNRKQLIELRNIAAARMTPDAVAEATRRVAAWKPRRVLKEPAP